MSQPLAGNAKNFCFLFFIPSIDPSLDLSALRLLRLFPRLTHLHFAHDSPPLQCPGSPIKLTRLVGFAKWWRLLRLLWRSSAQGNIPRGREDIFSPRFSFGRRGHRRRLPFIWSLKSGVPWGTLRMLSVDCYHYDSCYSDCFGCAALWNMAKTSNKSDVYVCQMKELYVPHAQKRVFVCVRAHLCLHGLLALGLC